MSFSASTSTSTNTDDQSIIGGLHAKIAELEDKAILTRITVAKLEADLETAEVTCGVRVETAKDEQERHITELKQKLRVAEESATLCDARVESVRLEREDRIAELQRQIKDAERPGVDAERGDLRDKLYLAQQRIARLEADGTRMEREKREQEERIAELRRKLKQQDLRCKLDITPTSPQSLGPIVDPTNRLVWLSGQLREDAMALRMLSNRISH
jgi:chromosome segregation ATPase